MTSADNAAPSSFGAWVAAARPRTLTMALAPVAVGAALAWAIAGRVNPPAVLTAALSALCIQIATNLFNDVGDFQRGADGPDRLGPPRAVASGLLDAASVTRAAYACFALAALGGLYLVVLGGWPILLLGLASILTGWAYAGGAFPISHTPLGELFVIAFFGLGAVGGTYWLCAGSLAPAALWAGLSLGLFAAAVLMINNFRDVAADARAGRRTLAIVVGKGASRALFAAMALIPFALLPAIAAAAPKARLWVAFAALPPALLLVWRFFREEPGPGLNKMLARMAQTQALYAVLLCLGAML